MTLPPPPNPYGSQPGPSWGGQNPGGQPPGFGGPPGSQPPWGPQPQWPGPAGPPPGRGGRGKWILGGLAVVLAIALAVVITVLVVRPDSSGGSSPTTTGAASEFASAGDVGPVNIITEDPTCEAWGKVSREFAGVQKSVKWEERDFSVPVNLWTPELRTSYETVGKAMTSAADQTANLAKSTPHRVMRELYEQVIAYQDLFVSKLATYTAQDDNLAVAGDAIGSALANMCAAIDFQSAQPLGPLVPAPAAPSKISSSTVGSEPWIFLATVNPTCSDWSATVLKYADDTAEWLKLDPQIPAADWTPEQKSVNAAVAPVMSANASVLGQLGRQSGNAIFEDIAVLASQYRRAFVTALPTYTPIDNYLSQSATYLVRTIDWACKAAA